VSTVPSRPRPLTAEDYALLPSDGRRWELLEGDFFVSPAPTSNHQFVVGALYVQLVAQLARKRLARVLVSPLDVFLDEINVVQPDLLVVSEDRKKLIARRGVVGAPDLVVEVISPSKPAQDLVLKRHLYERFGIAEYWIVDPDLSSILRLNLREGRYAETEQVAGRGTIHSERFPSLEVLVAEVFEDL
jgi:Uma2 family endonuclease